MVGVAFITFIGRLFACPLHGPIEGFGDLIAYGLLWLFYFSPQLFLVGMVFFFCFFLYIIISLISATSVYKWGYKKIKPGFVFLFSGFSKEKETGATE